MNEILDYLNGKKSIDGYTARNTSNSTYRRQKLVDKNQDADKLNMVRDKIMTLSVLNKMALFMIKLVNLLMKARVAVVFVSYGSGDKNSITRKDGCLFNQIPPAIFDKNVDSFKPFRDLFGLDHVKARFKNPCYMDFLADDAALMFLTFTKINGTSIVKRPSLMYNEEAMLRKYTSDQKERYQCFSEMVDINSSWGDLVIITPDLEVPVQNYLLYLEGSAHMISHFNHIGGITSHNFDRNQYSKVNTLDFLFILYKYSCTQ